MGRRKDGAETRARILKVAGDLFAEKGYERAVHEEICRLAAVSTSAINYYFQSKENLYKEAWLQAFNDSLERYPASGGVPEDAPPDERLRGRIVATVHRTIDPENIAFDIVYREIANPSGLLGEVIQEAILPFREELRSLIRALLGANATEGDILFCEMSIMGQCLNPMVLNKHFMRKWHNDQRKLAPEFDSSAYAEHIASFSVAGLREVARRLDAATQNA